MTRSSYIALCVALMLVSASAAALSNTLTSASFAAAPGKVFDSTVTGDKTNWGSSTEAVFGPGTTNSTLYVYGLTINQAGTSITSVVSRALNASLLSNGTADTTEAAVTGTDAVYSTAIAFTAGPIPAVGLGSAAIAYVAPDSASPACSQVFISIFTGGTASPTTKQITTYTCSHCTKGTAGTGTGYVNTVNSVFYENSTYYVTYTSTKYVETETGSGTDTCSSSSPSSAASASAGNSITTGQVLGYLQGVSASGSLKWTSPAAIYTGSASTAGSEPSPTATTVKPMCGPSNWTNSTNIICTYSTGASPNVITALPVPTATGTAGSGTTIATNVAATGNYPQTGTVYSVAGFVYSQFQQGVLLNKFDTITSAASNPTITYANTLTFYNQTTGATATAGGVSLNISNTYQQGQYGASGIPFSSGWGLIDSYSSAASTYASEWSAWYANGTMNGTKATIGTGSLPSVTVFPDANGALWAGSYSEDGTAFTLLTGYLGKLVSQIYPSSGSAGNILVTFFGLISLVLAALFVF